MLRWSSVSKCVATPDNSAAEIGTIVLWKVKKNAVVYCPVAVFCSSTLKCPIAAILSLFSEMTCREPVCFGAHAV